jgi:uncharacterized protein DUF2752
MQVYRRQLHPGETDYELVWCAVSIGSLAFAAGWLALGLPWPRCVFHDVTGLPCATCGMTRCAMQFFRGHLVAAFDWNPLVFVALCSVLVFDVYALAAIASGAPRWRISLATPRARMYARVFIVLALVLNWIYLLLHWRNF